MDHESVLRRLTLSDDAFVDSVLVGRSEASEELDERDRALVRIGALVSVDAGLTYYVGAVAAALAAGVTPEEMVAALLAVAPIAGAPRVVTAAPLLALALGYDVRDALESLDDPVLGA